MEFAELAPLTRKNNDNSNFWINLSSTYLFMYLLYDNNFQDSRVLLPCLRIFSIPKTAYHKYYSLCINKTIT